jgi:hypothetical protein
VHYAVLDTESTIVNVIVYNGIDAWAPPADHTLIELPHDSGAGIGWSYVDGEFVPPPEPSVESDVET